jgi:hypothetical protein
MFKYACASYANKDEVERTAAMAGAGVKRAMGA